MWQKWYICLRMLIALNWHWIVPGGCCETGKKAVEFLIGNLLSDWVISSSYSIEVVGN